MVLFTVVSVGSAVQVGYFAAMGEPVRGLLSGLTGAVVGSRLVREWSHRRSTRPGG